MFSGGSETQTHDLLSANQMLQSTELCPHEDSLTLLLFFDAGTIHSYVNSVNGIYPQELSGDLHRHSMLPYHTFQCCGGGRSRTHSTDDYVTSDFKSGLLPFQHSTKIQYPVQDSNPYLMIRSHTFYSVELTMLTTVFCFLCIGDVCCPRFHLDPKSSAYADWLHLYITNLDSFVYINSNYLLIPIG